MKLFMENKHVGYLLLGVSILVIVVILMFNAALKEIIKTSCGAEHSIICPMNQTVNQQTYLSFGIVGLLIIISLVLIFSKPQKEIIIKKVKEKKTKKHIDTSGLKPEEKKVLSLIQENKTIFQADIIEKTGFGKAKISRILDRLEGKGLIERNEWSDKEFLSVCKRVKNYEHRIDSQKGDLEGLRAFLMQKRDFLLGLLENPNLLEHESFTEALWTVFHLTDELVNRVNVRQLSEADYEHISSDIKRAYVSLIYQWLEYMKHLKDNYPYLFSFALRTNPFDPNASVEIK